MRSARLVGIVVSSFIALSQAVYAQEPAPQIPAPAPQRQDPAYTEPQYLADENAAIKDGFEIVELREHKGDPQREIVDREFASKIAERVGKGIPYGFDFEMRDVNGDGFADLILSLRMANMDPPPGVQGGPFFVYAFDGQKWRLVLESWGMLLGMKPAMAEGKPIGAYEFAFVQLDGYLHYVWNGSEFVKVPR